MSERRGLSASTGSQSLSLEGQASALILSPSSKQSSNDAVRVSDTLGIVLKDVKKVLERQQALLKDFGTLKEAVLSNGSGQRQEVRNGRNFVLAPTPSWIAPDNLLDTIPSRPDHNLPDVWLDLDTFVVATPEPEDNDQVGPLMKPSPDVVPEAAPEFRENSAVRFQCGEADVREVAGVEDSDRSSKPKAKRLGSMESAVSVGDRESSRRSSRQTSMSDRVIYAMSLDNDLEQERRNRALRKQPTTLTEEGPGDDDHSWAYFMRNLVHLPAFAASVAAAILLNTVTIVAESEHMARAPLEPRPFVFVLFSYCFAAFFVLELTLRVYSEGVFRFWFRSCCWSANNLWNWFDTMIVVLSVVEILVEFLNASGQVNLTHWRILRIMRITRILRIIRLQRFLWHFAPLRTIVFSIAAAMKSLMWAVALMVFIMYMFAIIFTQVLLDHPDVAGVQEFWATPTISCVTLFKSVTGGVSWHEPAKALSTVSPVLELVLIAYIIFTYIGVLNVITGVFCNSAIHAAEKDPSMIASSLMSNRDKSEKQMRELFGLLDQDGSGQVSLTELESLVYEPDVQARLAALDIQVDDAWMLFRLLDQDKSEIIECDEFVEGMLSLRGNAKSVDIAKMMYETRLLIKRITSMILCLAQALNVEKNFTTGLEKRVKKKQKKEFKRPAEGPPATDNPDGSGGSGHDDDAALAAANLSAALEAVASFDPGASLDPGQSLEPGMIEAQQ